MDVERTIEFILQMQAKSEERMAKYDERMAKSEERMAKFDKRLEATRKIVETGMKLMVKLDKKFAHELFWNSGWPDWIKPIFRPIWPEMRVPTLVVHGTADNVVDVGNARLLADAIEGARLQLFEGVGHLLPWERPQEFTALVEGFLG